MQDYTVWIGVGFLVVIGLLIARFFRARNRAGSNTWNAEGKTRNQKK
jgi:hypothetical protein